MGHPQHAPVQGLRKQVFSGSSRVSVSCAWRGEGPCPVGQLRTLRFSPSRM